MPMAVAAAATDRPRSSRFSRTNAPGCGGFFIAIGPPHCSMVVHKIDIACVTGFEAEDDAPVRPHGDRPESTKVAPQRMRAERMNVQVFRPRRRVQCTEDKSNSPGVLGRHTARIVVLVEASQAPVATARDHGCYVKCKLSFVNRMAESDPGLRFAPS